MTYKLSRLSNERLQGVHPKLVEVVRLAITKTKQDFFVLEGVRTPERQQALYAQGRTKPGPKVTWTLTSNHFKDPKTGFGHAVDLAPYPLDWNDLKKFDAISKAVFEAAKELGVTIRWGADWNQNGKPRERGESDSPHFEIKL